MQKKTKAKNQNNEDAVRTITRDDTKANKRPLHARLRTITVEIRSCEITKQRNMKVAKTSTEKKAQRLPVGKS